METDLRDNAVERVEWANALRGLAALCVLVSHYAATFWTHQGIAADLARRPPLYSGAEGIPFFARLFDWLPINIGVFGVAIFFLLSGYVISISLASYGRSGFLIGRAMRLLPTYAAGYLVTCAVIWAMSDPKGELGFTAVSAGMAPGLPMLLNVASPKDGIVWTLIVEIVFYVFCSAFHRRLATCWKTIAAVGVFCALACLLIAPAPPFAGLKSIFLMACPFLPVILIGVVLASYKRGDFNIPQARLLFLFLLSLHLVLVFTGAAGKLPIQAKLSYIAGILFFTFIWAVAGNWRQTGVSRFIADVSYPLYVVHPVLGYALLSILAANGLGAGTAVLITTLAAFLAAYFLHRLVEKPTHRLGRRWARSVSLSATHRWKLSGPLRQERRA